VLSSCVICGCDCRTADVGRVMFCACYESGSACLVSGVLKNAESTSKKWEATAYVHRVSKIICLVLLLAIM
jgi:hypothetical protein